MADSTIRFALIWKITSTFILAAVALCGCSSFSTLPKLGPLVEKPIPEAYAPPTGKWSVVASLTFSVYGHRDSVLCGAEFDSTNRSGSIVCLQPSGMKLLEVSFVGDEITHQFIIPELEKYNLKPEDVARDLRRISFDVDTKDGACESDDIRLIFDKKTGLLSEKTKSKDDKVEWTIFYRRYKLLDDLSVPCEIRMDNFRLGYSLLIRTRRFSLIRN